MAIMYPEHGPKTNASTSAEPAVYELLKTQLEDDFRVIHSIPWLSSIVESYSPKCSGIGEIDFLILHPEYGALAIEVKGGHLHHDRSGFYYLRRNSDSNKQRIDLYDQASRGRFALQHFLQERSHAIKIGLAFFLCDSEIGNAQLPPYLSDIGEGIAVVFDIRDKSLLSGKIKAVMQHYKAVYKSPTLSEAAIEHIIDCILPSKDYGPCWQSRIASDEVTWLKMTEEQEECTHLAVQKDRCIISGWPGSGKTLVGISVARRLCESGQRVLFIAFNGLLTQKIAHELEKHSQCDVYRFHQLCVAAENHLAISYPGKRPKGWYEKTSAQSLKSAISQGFLEKYDSLIVDEAQIIRRDWWDVLFSAFQKKRIVTMCDESQIFPYETPISLHELESIVGVQCYLLTQSLRTPKKVCNKLKQIISPTYSIVNPRPLVEDTYSEIVSTNLTETVRDLVIEFEGNNIPPDQVTFLFEYSHRNFEWLRDLGYTVESIGRFRGVEAPIVVIYAAGEMSATTLFCAYSRCTSSCIVIVSAADVVEGRYTAVEDATKAKAIDLYGGFVRESQAVYLIEHPQLTRSQLDLESIELLWCDEWQAYLLPGEAPQSLAWTLWSGYFETLEEPCIFGWKSPFEQEVLFFTSKNNDPIWPSFQRMLISLCAACENATPHMYIEGVLSCYICSEGFQHERNLDFEGRINKLDNMVCRPENFSNEEKRLMPSPVFALAALRKLGLDNDFTRKCIADVHGLSCQVVLVLVMIETLRLYHKGERYIAIKTLSQRLKSWNNDFQSMSQPKFAGLVSASVDKMGKAGIVKITKNKGVREIDTNSAFFRGSINRTKSVLVK